jgi:hypothetical protein
MTLSTNKDDCDRAQSQQLIRQLSGVRATVAMFQLCNNLAPAGGPVSKLYVG